MCQPLLRWRQEEPVVHGCEPVPLRGICRDTGGADALTIVSRALAGNANNVILGLGYPLRLPILCALADLRQSRFQITDHEPVGEQPQEKNDRGEFKAWNIGAVRGDQEPNCEWCDDSREITREVLSPGPYADVFRWRARLKDCEQVARSKPYQRS